MRFVSNGLLFLAFHLFVVISEADKFTSGLRGSTSSHRNGEQLRAELHEQIRRQLKRIAKGPDDNDWSQIDRSDLTEDPTVDTDSFAESTTDDTVVHKDKGKMALEPDELKEVEAVANGIDLVKPKAPVKKSPQKQMSAVSLKTQISLESWRQHKIQKVASAGRRPVQINLHKPINLMTVNYNVEKSHNDALDNLEQSVLKLVAQGVTPAETNLLVNIQAILDTKMKVEIMGQFNATRDELDKRFEAIGKCTTPSHLRASPEKYGLSKLAEKYRTCRHAEKRLMEERDTLKSQSDASKLLKDQYCGYAERNATPSTQPGIGQCNFDNQYYQGGEAVIDYMRDQLEFWDGIWKVLKFSRERCDKQKKIYVAEGGKLSYTQVELNSTKRTCDHYQDGLDVASCRYKAATLDQCSTYTSCYNSTLQAYESVWQKASATTSTNGTSGNSDALFTQEFLRAQYASVRRIECYLDAMKAPNTQEEMDRCQASSMANDPQVQRITFPVRVIDGRRQCGEGLTLQYEDDAGRPEFATKYYTGDFNLRKTCDQICCAQSTAAR
eukprot:TRINITY_DN6539_c4_g1_i1.p1 TRINITY_DN6539_c4_g1~~TRINITY_DN6539_c4_g1_i1.p1  ORF type:complete len:554 (-),score=99.22 TRINITY_DN6539_c4_g1_i1:141-1802(-)